MMSIDDDEEEARAQQAEKIITNVLNNAGLSVPLKLTVLSRLLAVALTKGLSEGEALYKAWFTDCFGLSTNFIRLYAARHFGDPGLARDVDDEEMAHVALGDLTRPN